jgi:hypothetical protein
MADDIYQMIEQRPERETSTALEKPFDKEKWAAAKKAEREEVYAKIDTATQRITDDPTAFLGFLDVVARFPRYSVPNCLLVFEQMPDATRVAGFEAWKERGVSVKKGQGAIAILEPGDEYTREDGTIGVSFNVKKVFDITQTSSRHLEPRHPDTRSLLFALIDKAPVGIKTAVDLDAMEFARYDHESKMILVKPGMEPQSLFKALAVELAHVSLAGQDIDYDREAHRETALFAGYVVAKRSGIESSGIMPVFTPRSESGSLQAVREELGRIRGAAKEITDRMDKVLDAKQKEAQPKENAPSQKSRGGRDER